MAVLINFPVQGQPLPLRLLGGKLRERTDFILDERLPEPLLRLLLLLKALGPG